MPSTRTPSRRATAFWKRMIQSWGGRLTDDYGRTCPEDWAEVIDRTDPERLEKALIALRQESPIHPPTLGQLQSSIPKRQLGQVKASTFERLASYAVKTLTLCEHQLWPPWSYFGEIVDDGTRSGYCNTKGVVIPVCTVEGCFKQGQGHRIFTSDLPPEAT